MLVYTCKNMCCKLICMYVHTYIHVMYRYAYMYVMYVCACVLVLSYFQYMLIIHVCVCAVHATCTVCLCNLCVVQHYCRRTVLVLVLVRVYTCNTCTSTSTSTVRLQQCCTPVIHVRTRTLSVCMLIMLLSTELCFKDFKLLIVHYPKHV